MKKPMIYTGLAVAFVVAALFTLANKRWLGRRIVAKWDVTTGSEPGDPWTVFGPDWNRWSLPQLYAAWTNGKPGWYPKGQRPDLATTTEFDVK